MKKSGVSPLEARAFKRMNEDPEFAEAFFEDLAERPLVAQLSILRRMGGMSQVQLAALLKVPQSFVSKLEKTGTDHRMSVYELLAKALHVRLAFIPEGAKILLPHVRQKLRSAA